MRVLCTKDNYEVETGKQTLIKGRIYYAEKVDDNTAKVKDELKNDIIFNIQKSDFFEIIKTSKYIFVFSDGTVLEVEAINRVEAIKRVQELIKPVSYENYDFHMYKVHAEITSENRYISHEDEDEDEPQQ